MIIIILIFFRKTCLLKRNHKSQILKNGQSQRGYNTSELRCEYKTIIITSVLVQRSKSQVRCWKIA